MHGVNIIHKLHVNCFVHTPCAQNLRLYWAIADSLYPKISALTNNYLT